MIARAFRRCNPTPFYSDLITAVLFALYLLSR